MDTTLHEHADELIETRLEFRDGGPWLVGVCPGCWELVAVRIARGAPPPRVTCENGHTLRVKELRSAGAVHYAMP